MWVGRMPASKKILEEKQVLLNRLITSGLLQQFKKNAIELHYSQSMFVDLLYRDYSSWVENFNRRVIRRLLLLWGVKHDNKKYLRLPQEVKLQFKYPATMSLEEIRELQRCRSLKGAEITQKLRKSWLNYTPKNHSDFWIKRGLNLNDAEKAAAEFRASKSPHSRLFVKYALLSDEEISDKISDYAAARGLLGLEAQQYCVSKIEKIIQQALTNYQIEFFTQKRLRSTKCDRDNDVALQRLYVYDIYVPKYNMLIECNGTYWHADPRVYASTDIINYPYGSLTAKLRWEKDEKKKKFAELQGFIVMYVWELDVYSDNYIQMFMEKLTHV